MSLLLLARSTCLTSSKVPWCRLQLRTWTKLIQRQEPTRPRLDLIRKHEKLIEFAQTKCFRTTPPNQIPPGIWVFLRPMTKVAAVLAGRRIRQWWQSLPPNRRDELRLKMKKYRHIFYGLVGAYLFSCLVYYLTHLVETPITKRVRFLAVSDKQYQEVSDHEFESTLHKYKEHLLDVNHPIAKRISRIALHILKANRDLPQIRDKEWSITVVDVPSIENAFVLPNGQIFVFSGILGICKNDDQLGVVLAHEIAHCVLGHGAELLSHGQFLDLMLVCIIFAIWTVLPTDILAALAHFVMSKFTDLTIALPYSRTLETEADLVGLQIASKACLDVREAVAFWQQMDLKEKIALKPLGVDLPETIDYLSTHPKHEKRAEYLNTLIPEAIRLREECKCWRLPRKDPREQVKRQMAEFERLNSPHRHVSRLTI